MPPKEILLACACFNHAAKVDLIPLTAGVAVVSAAWRMAYTGHKFFLLLYSFLHLC